jgi:hypothetical protein
VRVLFIVKKRPDYCSEYDCETYSYADSFGGLYNSARFVVEMLNAHGITAKVVLVVDNNSIDREVTAFKPDVVIIEALWVVPEKFAVLTELHPHVEWVVRIHSEIPFLATEGIAMDWIVRYLAFDSVSVACNSKRATEDLQIVASEHYNPVLARDKVVYLPNWYPSTPIKAAKKPDGWLDIGCFGAIRPFKNQLIQAIAAIDFAKSADKFLSFHINASRCEQQGDNILKNLRALFAGTSNLLVEHPWQDHDDFLKTVAQMDASMAVSFTETFNIVSADAVVCRVPIVVSSEVSWAASTCVADTTDIDSIVSALKRVTSQPRKWLAIQLNLRNLGKYDSSSVSTWLDYLQTV